MGWGAQPRPYGAEGRRGWLPPLKRGTLTPPGCALPGKSKPIGFVRIFLGTGLPTHQRCELAQQVEGFPRSQLFGLVPLQQKNARPSTTLQSKGLVPWELSLR